MGIGGGGSSPGRQPLPKMPSATEEGQKWHLPSPTLQAPTSALHCQTQQQVQEVQPAGIGTRDTEHSEGRTRKEWKKTGLRCAMGCCGWKGLCNIHPFLYQKSLPSLPHPWSSTRSPKIFHLGATKDGPKGHHGRHDLIPFVPDTGHSQRIISTNM